MSESSEQPPELSNLPSAEALLASAESFHRHHASRKVVLDAQPRSENRKRK